MTRLHACPICKCKDTVATMVFEREDTPQNQFVVMCTNYGTKGGCGFRTGAHDTWAEAIAEWKDLCEQHEPLRLIVTNRCDCGAIWHSGTFLNDTFTNTIETLDDDKICPVCNQRGYTTKISLRAHNDDDYPLMEVK